MSETKADKKYRKKPALSPRVGRIDEEV